ncbi:MAG TPA: hypothetical protein PLP25_11595 [Candidatus Limiplasma sp.]|nr:hypothetical protein [Candidatus Limiplasma sp.]HPS82489.1 hypothetical protein [Candidatus Limiplasma sp.]
MNRQGQDTMYAPGYPQQSAPLPEDQDVEYVDYSNPGFEEEDYSDYNEELDDTHRFHVAMNVFNVISVLAGLAIILVLVAILVSLLTWLQGDITQSFTLLTSQFKQ